MTKKIVLKKLELKNFRGQNHIVEFNGDVTTISGRNGVGKSTIYKSFMWLLTSYPSSAELRNFNLFDNRVELSPDTPKASVKAYVNIDGVDYTIEREAEAKFVRRRGSNEYEKASSDTYTIRVDEIEMSSSDFTSWVDANIAPTDMLPYCLDGGFFIELLADKTKARNTLEKIIGDIRAEDMRGDYSVIADDMRKYSVDLIEERTKNELKPYKARLAEIPAVIDNMERSLAEYTAIDFGAIDADIAKTRQDIEDIDDAILGKGKEIEPIMGERNRIFDLISDKTAALNAKRREYTDKCYEGVRTAEKALRDAERINADAERVSRERLIEWEMVCEKLNREKRNLSLLEERREGLVREKDEIKARLFTDDRCAYCGQELPADAVEESRARFNEKKRADYDNVVGRGKNIAEQIVASKEEIAHLQEIVSAGCEGVERVDCEPLREKIREESLRVVPFEDTEEYARLSAEIRSLGASLPELPSDDSAALTEAKRVLMTTLETLNRRYGLKAKADEIRESIHGLRAEMREVGNTIARLEGKIDKCKEYKQEKADIISFRVNDRLTEARLEMWSRQKNGDLVPDVILLGKEGVRFASLNASNQIKTRIELQELFMSHFDISLPVFVDEARIFDSTNLPHLTHQTVFLYASDAPALVVE